MSNLSELTTAIPTARGCKGVMCCISGVNIARETEWERCFQSVSLWLSCRVSRSQLYWWRWVVKLWPLSRRDGSKVRSIKCTTCSPRNLSSTIRSPLDTRCNLLQSTKSKNFQGDALVCVLSISFMHKDSSMNISVSSSLLVVLCVFFRLCLSSILSEWIGTWDLYVRLYSLWRIGLKKFFFLLYIGLGPRWHFQWWW